jgi:hypothetical protein
MKTETASKRILLTDWTQHVPNINDCYHYHHHLQRPDSSSNSYGTENWTKAKAASRITAAETEYPKDGPQNLYKETTKAIKMK